MARPFTSALHIARKALESNQGWLWFLKVDMVSGEQIRIVRANTHRTLSGVQWQRSDFDLDLSPEDANGAQSLRVTVPNVARIASARVANNQLLGDVATFSLVHESETVFNMSRAFRFLIGVADLTAVAASFECGTNPDLLQIPGPSYSRVNFPQLLPTAGVRRRV